MVVHKSSLNDIIISTCTYLPLVVLDRSCNLGAAAPLRLLFFHLTVKPMAKGLSVGDRVCANATEVLSAQRATAGFGKQASKVQMRGS